MCQVESIPSHVSSQVGSMPSYVTEVGPIPYHVTQAGFILSNINQFGSSILMCDNNTNNQKCNSIIYVKVGSLNKMMKKFF